MIITYYGNTFQIVVYALKPNSRNPYVLYRGAVQSRKKLFLFYENDYFDVIPTITAFLRNRAYCYECLNPMECRSNHKYKYLCEHCEEYHERADEERAINCSNCLRTFPSTSCYLNHNMKSKGKPVCYYGKLCSQCAVKVDNRKRGKIILMNPENIFANFLNCTLKRTILVSCKK